MTKTWAVVSVFNEISHLEKTLDSIRSSVDGIIVVDGAYKTFPYTGNNGASDDGTIEFLLKYQREVYPGLEIVYAPEGGWETEMEKRTAYCDLVPEGDWLFIIDGDEELVAGGNHLNLLESFRQDRDFDLGIVLIHFINGDSSHYGEMGRLYKKKKGMKYDKSHSHVVYDGGYRWRTLFLPVVIREDHSVRSEERDAHRRAFYKSGLMK